MRNVPYKIIITIALYTFITLPFLLTGCSGPPEREFVPPVFPPAPADPRFIYERTIRSSGDISELTAAQKFQIFATGTRSAIYGVSKPYGIAVQEGRIYVTDSLQRSILLFDVPKGEFKFIGNEEGPGGLAKPLGIDIDPAGNIYTADVTTRRIVIYNRDGEYLGEIGGPQIFDRPTGVAVSPSGDKVYVVDTGGVSSKRHHLHIFDAVTTELIKTVGERGNTAGNFNLPLQVATAPDGTVYVVDGGNFRIQAFTPDGEFKMMFGRAGKRTGNFSRPKGIATDRDGNIYVADTAFGNFQIFNDKGELLLFVGNRSERGSPATFMLPSGIEVDEDGRVYMADQFFRKIDVFRPVNLTVEDGYLGTRHKEVVQEQLELEKANN